jgi:glycosyltransferase involved in cell wall biosynthesis
VGELILRVTMISKACVVGAYQTNLEAIAAQTDVDLTVIVPPYWREGAHKLMLERAHTAGYTLIVAPLAFNGRFHLHFYPTLPAILRHARPDICHVDEEPYNLATCLAVQAARRVGARTLFFTWQNLLRPYPWPVSALEKYVYAHVDAAIAGNQDALQVLREKGYAGRIHVLPQFGVDPDLFQPAGARPGNGPLTIGYAGRLVEQKGLYTLAEALIGLPGMWRLVLCGTGPLRADLAARLAASGLEARVTFLEHIPSQEMPRQLAGMDMVVLPSLTRPHWKEQFGRILVEAMSCGVPVVGSDSGEIPRVIGEAGLVFPEGDAAALRACLAALLGDARLRRDLGAKGRARVLAHYTQAQIAAETVALYRTLAGRPAAPET